MFPQQHPPGPGMHVYGARIDPSPTARSIFVRQRAVLRFNNDPPFTPRPYRSGDTHFTVQTFFDCYPDNPEQEFAGFVASGEAMRLPEIPLFTCQNVQVWKIGANFGPTEERCRLVQEIGKSNILYAAMPDNQPWFVVVSEEDEHAALLRKWADWSRHLTISTIRDGKFREARILAERAWLMPRPNIPEDLAIFLLALERGDPVRAECFRNIFARDKENFPAIMKAREQLLAELET
jgi:hypothetical protein